jgi:exopolyphosphatase/guanosine-5'-triphosphate,3'-diphosphate pyrophosphatase
VAKEHHAVDTDRTAILRTDKAPSVGNGAACPPEGTSPHRTDTGSAQSHRRRRRRRPPHPHEPVYGALDLGTNNCRLLVACPSSDGFKVIDAFSRIVRLGEGANGCGFLSEAAMVRTIEALKVCTGKLARRNVSRFRLIATEACRTAGNGQEFIERVHRSTGLRLEIVDRETEARLAVAGSISLIDPACARALVFDIGGGSTELMQLSAGDGVHRLKEWISLPVGVVTLAERHGGIHVDEGVFAAMMDEVRPAMSEFMGRAAADCISDHMLGTSGTVTTIAGVHQNLRRYDRARVDGAWISRHEIRDVTDRLLAMSYADRAANPCIGPDRADLVLAGCAILATMLELWPCDRVRVADRGLREGILTELMMEDGTFGRAMHRPGDAQGRRGRRWRGRAGRDRGLNGAGAADGAPEAI